MSLRNDCVYPIRNHDLAKRLFANLGLSFKETPEYYAPSLWVMHGDVIVGEILQEENGQWYSNTRWGSKDYIGSSRTTECKELAALEEIHNKITALLLNEFQNNGSLRIWALPNLACQTVRN